jgi:hypothetical protein
MSLVTLKKNSIQSWAQKQVLFCLLKVPIDERNSVHEDAVKKLKKIWMGFNEIQLYTLSTKEALWIQKDDLIVGRFA